MQLQAVIFGGIGSLVETSELQRDAFNAAFAEAGLNWNWDRETYRELLSMAGGQKRIRYFNAEQDMPPLPAMTVQTVHRRKTELFQEALQSAELAPRAGVQRLIEKARSADMQLAIASTTSLSNITSLADASGIDLDAFDLVLHRGLVTQPKPDPEVYQRCLGALDIAAIEAVAIEDSDSGVAAAVAGGLHCVAMPGANTASQDYGRASLIVADGKDIEDLTAQVGRFRAPRITALDLASFQQLAAAIR